MKAHSEAQPENFCWCLKKAESEDGFFAEPVLIASEGIRMTG
jgi:hypothetical protein